MSAIAPTRKAPDVLTITDPDRIEELANLLLGFGHEVRLRIVQTMRDGKEYSPKQLADILAPAPLGVVAYHVRMMRQYGLMVEVRTEPRRGALMHFYMLTPQARELERRLRKPLVKAE